VHEGRLSCGGVAQ